MRRSSRPFADARPQRPSKRLPKETGAAMMRVDRSTRLPTVPNPADKAFAVRSRMPLDESSEESFLAGAEALAWCGAGAGDGACAVCRPDAALGAGAAISAGFGFTGVFLPEAALDTAFVSFAGAC